jgi:cob(I)alamin adenosyltransferase
MLNKKNPNQAIAKKGLTICYIGDGKGKTSAAMGLAARASGAGLNVYILQFVKAKKPKDGDKLNSGEWPLSSEIQFYNKVSVSRGMGKIETEQVGIGFVGILGDRKQRDEHIREAVRGLEIARKVITDPAWQVIILDEVVSAVELDLLSELDILDIIALKPKSTHLVMTGHSKCKKIITACDLVTEMKMLKHPYYNGVLAQKGIDY